MSPLVVLNVAEKPSVARALAEVFAQSPGSVNRPMQRGEAAQVFCSENVRFPNLARQGSGRPLPPNAGPDVPHTMITIPAGSADRQDLVRFSQLLEDYMNS